ncbi:glycosyltransferase [Scytonema hofmannii PCC 7110]|uniref:Glycosyltransferase n=1 Tax=Scytonema hofmannii PCC 7110 TaxID=128403 RepID=A0A139X309_9CYAN|nr:glycosyltransferase [Scytonema hofmannii]KYC39085.1 glycosyltransferase [Scytonema hofmannii PCC 7110]
MKLLFPNEKIEKLKYWLQIKGTLGLLRYLYQRIAFSLKVRSDYQKWVARNRLTKQDIAAAKEQIDGWLIHPKFSVIMPVYNVEADWLKKAIESVQNQIYPYWELCIADDASTKPHIRRVLDEYSQRDSRLKVVFCSENKGISSASNSALEMATGDYIVLLDHDDELTLDALFENAKLINKYPEADFIYSDEDKIDTKGYRFTPNFKPDWSPEYFYSCMYTCHLGVYRAKIIREIGGFRRQYDGSQDYDLVLRVIEKTKNIYHIPKILYHWRSIPSSAAAGSQAKPWAYTAAKKALEAMIERSPYPGHVEVTSNPGIYRIRRDILGNPLISIIIPGNGQAIATPSDLQVLIRNCICSIEQLSTYRNYEIVVVDGFDIAESIMEEIKRPNLQIIRCDKFLKKTEKINIGVTKARGQFLLLLSEEVEVITSDWLESMLELAQQTEIGAVGAKILLPNRKIHHIGVVFLEGNYYHPFSGFDSEAPGYHCSNIVNKNCLAITAACLMIKKELFQELGRLDESFSSIDVSHLDLCLKAHQMGYRNVITPYAQLTHYKPVNCKKSLPSQELTLLNEKWNNYLNELKKDPYYNSNLSHLSNIFPLASISDKLSSYCPPYM